MFKQPQNWNPGSMVKVGFLSLLVVEKIATVKDAKTCLFVPETGRLYLAVPRQEGKEGPEIRIYQTK